jgi:mRNA interferase RelE/StbE
LAWKIEYTETALKQMKKLDKSISKKNDYLVKKIAKNPVLFGKPLLHNLSGYWRYRIGDIRIICNIENKFLTVLVAAVKHRRDAYK